MSETPRSYSTSGAGFSMGRRASSRRIGRILFFVALIALVYAFWISRDTHSLAEFVEADRRLEIVIPRANVARHRLVESRVWNGVPPEWAANWPGALENTHGLPEWVVANLVGSGAIAVADDFENWSDLVVVSRMTRAGCLIERALRFTPSTASEWAGGLHLRYWEPGGVHYAVRGRALLVSPSRDALIRALTLAPDRRVEPKAARAALAEAGAEDARGTFTLDETDAAGRALSKIQFAVRVEAGEALVKIRAAFRPELAGELRPLLAGTKPVDLPPPIAGPVAISADFGTNVADTWRVLSSIFESQWLTAEQWESWRSEDPADSPASALTAVLGPMGPAFRVTWQDTDLLEMAPVPVLVGSIAGSRERVEAALDSLASPDDARVADARVVYDRQADTLAAPLMSGPSMTPVARWSGDTLYFSTSSREAESFFADGRSRTFERTRAGNLSVQIDPSAAMQQIVAVGRELAQSDMLRGYTEESFAKDSAVWLERAAVIETALAIASINYEGIEAELYIKCAPSRAE